MIFCHQPCHHQRLRKMRWNITGNIQTQDPEKPAVTTENMDTLQLETETTPKAKRILKRGRRGKKKRAPMPDLLSDSDTDSDMCDFRDA